MAALSTLKFLVQVLFLCRQKQYLHPCYGITLLRYQSTSTTQQYAMFPKAAGLNYHLFNFFKLSCWLHTCRFLFCRAALVVLPAVYTKGRANGQICVCAWGGPKQSLCWSYTILARGEGSLEPLVLLPTAESSRDTSTMLRMLT